jgi:hypothetical protein
MLTWPNPALEPARSQEAAREFAGEILRAVEQLTAREELERQARAGAPFPVAPKRRAATLHEAIWMAIHMPSQPGIAETAKRLRAQ